MHLTLDLPLSATDITACACCGNPVELQHTVADIIRGRRCLGCVVFAASWPPPF